VSAPAPDPHRVTPPCERYGTCGGCPLMHLDAAGQSGARRWLVHRALANEGLGDVEVRRPSSRAPPARPTSATSSRSASAGAPRGASRSARGAATRGTWCRSPSATSPRRCCAARWSRWPTTRCSSSSRRGTGARACCGRPVLRASRSTGEVLITLVAARKDKALLDLAEEVARGIPEVVGVWLHLNGEEGNAIFAKDDQGVVGALHLVGRDTIEDRLGAITYRIGPGELLPDETRRWPRCCNSRVLDELQVGAERRVRRPVQRRGRVSRCRRRGGAGRSRWGVEEIEGGGAAGPGERRAPTASPPSFLWGRGGREVLAGARGPARGHPAEGRGGPGGPARASSPA
jgi:hypothetical protein